MVFTVSIRRYIGNYETIVTHDEEGHEIPVMHILPGETDFPGDIKHLAANLASLLNGNEPLYQLDTGEESRLFWKENENGCEFRIMKKEGY